MCPPRDLIELIIDIFSHFFVNDLTVKFVIEEYGSDKARAMRKVFAHTVN